MKIKNLYEGRINRRQYLNGMLLVIVVAWVLTSIIFYFISGTIGETESVQAIASFISIPFTLGLVIKRLHDIGSSGKIYVIYLVLSSTFSLLFPTVAKDIFALLNFGIGITILLTPGETKYNRYGEVPSKMSTKEIVFGKKITTTPLIKLQETRAEKPVFMNEINKSHKDTTQRKSFSLPIGLRLGVSIAIVMITGLFYWFEYRPSKIKQQCSWIEEKTEAVPYRKAMNRGEMILNGLLEDCTKETFANNPNWNSLEKIELEKRLCEVLNDSKVKEYSVEQEAIPSKSWWRKATTKEYEFCLHSRGL